MAAASAAKAAARAGSTARAATEGPSRSFRAKRYAVATAAGAGGAGAVGLAGSARDHQTKAQKADNIGTATAVGSIAGGLGGYAVKKAKPASTFAKNRGISAALAGVSTGAALVAAHHVSRRDKAEGVAGKQRAKDVGLAAIGWSVDRPKTGSRVSNKGRSPNKGRSSCKDCNH